MSRESDFTNKREKAESISSGFVADHEGDTYILKQFFTKNGTHGLSDRAARREAATELLASGVFKEILQDKAPDIALVEGTNGGEAYLSSKFFKDFKTLSEFTAGKDATSVSPSDSKIRDIKGLEEVISACAICGEIDIHAGNLGIVPAHGEDGSLLNVEGRQQYDIVKIDHGRALSEKHDSESSLRSSLAEKFSVVGYETIPFNISKFKSSLETQAQHLSDDAIASSMGNKVREMRDLGVEVSSIAPFGAPQTFAAMFDPALAPAKPVRRPRGAPPEEAPPPKSPEELARIEDGAYSAMKEYYKDRIKDSREKCKDLVSTLSIIEKIDGPSEWKDGKWLADIKGENPLSWAIDNDRTIEGKNPIIWARVNKERLTEEGVYPFKNDKGEALDPLEYDKSHGWKIAGKSPDEYCAEKSIPVFAHRPDPGALRATLERSSSSTGGYITIPSAAIPKQEQTKNM